MWEWSLWTVKAGPLYYLLKETDRGWESYVFIVSTCAHVHTHITLRRAHSHIRVNESNRSANFSRSTFHWSWESPSPRGLSSLQAEWPAIAAALLFSKRLSGILDLEEVRRGWTHGHYLRQRALQQPLSQHGETGTERKNIFSARREEGLMGDTNKPTTLGLLGRISTTALA